MRSCAVWILCAALALLPAWPAAAENQYPPPARKMPAPQPIRDPRAWIIAGAVLVGAGVGLVIAGTTTTLVGRDGREGSQYYRRLETDGLIVIGASAVAIIPGVIALAVGERAAKKAAASPGGAPKKPIGVVWYPVFAGAAGGGLVGAAGRF